MRSRRRLSLPGLTLLLIHWLLDDLRLKGKVIQRHRQTSGALAEPRGHSQLGAEASIPDTSAVSLSLARQVATVTDAGAP